MFRAPSCSAALRAAPLLFFLSGCKACGAGGGEVPDAGGHAQPKSLTSEQSAQVLAKVGETTITLGDYVAALEHMDQFDRLRYQSPERRKELLTEMINVELLAMEATAKGYDKDPLAQQELRAILRDAMLAEARKDAPPPTEIPESEVRAWFEAHRAEYKDPERRRVSVIVTRDEATATLALSEVKKDPTNSAKWGEVVRARSTDAQARANVPVDLAGDVGIVSPPDDPRGENPRVPQAVRVAVFSLPEVGIHDKVVADGGKFYVVRLTQKFAPHERTFEEAERSIRVKLSQDRLRAKEDALIAELRRSVKVEVDEAALATVRAQNAADAGR